MPMNTNMQKNKSPMRRTAPGGFSSICLGTDAHSFPNRDKPATQTNRVVLVKPAPGGTSTIHFGSDKPTTKSTTASCHNTTEEREYVATPRFNGPPGGKSTIHLGDHNACFVSSNAYASRHNQNAGNVLTDRPSTRLHAPPGGNSTISFGVHKDISSTTRNEIQKTAKKPAHVPTQKKENKENNTSKRVAGVTPRKFAVDYSTRMQDRKPPGGATTIRLG